MLRINVIARGEPLQDEEASDSLATLNEMLHAWETDGIHLGHTNLGLEDTIELPDNHMRGVRLLLALELLGEFEKPAETLLITQADRAKRQLIAEYQVIPEAKFDTALTDFQANRSQYDINRG